jgi:hypothetical protein
MSDQTTLDLSLVELTDMINKARRSVLEGNSLSIEDQAMLVKLLRQSRMAASEAGTKARTKRAAKGLDDDALMDSLNAAFNSPGG